MKDKQALEQKVRQACARTLPPGDFANILTRCEETGERILVVSQPTSRRLLRMVSALTAALFLLIGLYIYRMNFAVASNISLDVNPSIEITVNEKARVLRVTPKNADAEAIIGSMDFSGSSVEVTVNALLGSMLRAGYLDDIADAILVSVESADGRESVLLQQLTELVEQFLGEAAVEGRLLTQTVEASRSLAEKAEQNSITLGKAQMIEMIEAWTGYSFAELSGLSIGTLNALMSNKLSDTSASYILSKVKDGFITKADALAKAAELIELSEAQLENVQCTVAEREGRIVYRICCDDIKYRFYIHVDARRGEAVLVNREMHIYRLENLSEERLHVLDAALAHAKLKREDIIICSMTPTNRTAIGLEDYYRICFMTKDKSMYYDYQVGRDTYAIFAAASMPYQRSPHARVPWPKNGYVVPKNTITLEDMEAGTLEAIRRDCGLTKEQFTIKTSVSLIANLRPNTVSYMIKFTTADGEYKYICDVLKDYEIIDKTFTPAN